MMRRVLMYMLWFIAGNFVGYLWMFAAFRPYLGV